MSDEQSPDEDQGDATSVGSAPDAGRPGSDAPSPGMPEELIFPEPWAAPVTPTPPPPAASSGPPTQPAGPPIGWPQPAAASTWSASAPPTPPPRSPAKPRGARNALLAAVAGGLAGALVASGVFIATKDDGKTTTVVRSAPVARNTSVIAKPQDIEGILAKVLPGVVSIQVGTTDSGPLGGRLQTTGAGSGFVISSDGVVVTNFHVIEQADHIDVTFQDGTKKTAKVLGKSSGNDLAVLKVDGSNLPTVELGDSNKLQVGDDVIAIGNALALDGGPTVTKGIISALHRQIAEQANVAIDDLIQTDAAINRGNSGGPLVNSAGEVVGINTAIADPSVAQNIGFAISISHAEPVIDQLRQGKEVKQAFLGVHVVTDTPAIANELDLKVQTGAVVRSVQSGTPADDAGIRESDVIVKIDGKVVKTAEDVQATVRSKRPKDTIEIELNRDGKTVTVKATLSELAS